MRGTQPVREAAQLFAGNAGFGDHGRQVQGRDPAPECGPAMGVAGEPFLIHQVVFGQDLRDAQRQQSVRARAGAEVQIRPPRAPAPDGIDHHDPASLAVRAADKGHEMGRGADRVVPPENQQTRVEHVVIRRAHAFAQCGAHGVPAARHADGPLQAAGSQAIPEPAAGDGHLHQPQRAAVAVGQDTFRSMGRDQALPAFGDFPDGFLPADSLPLPRPPAARPAQGCGQPVGMVDTFKIGVHLGAEPPVCDRMFRLGLEGDGASLFHPGTDAAGIRAVVGTGPVDPVPGSLYVHLWLSLRWTRMVREA